MDRFTHIHITHLFVSQITSSKVVILILCYLKNLSKNISVRQRQIDLLSRTIQQRQKYRQDYLLKTFQTEFL